MPTYIIEGKEVETEGKLSDADIDEIAASIRGQQPTQQQPTEGGITSGFAMGLKDPITAGAQLLPRGLEFASSLGGFAPNPVSEFFGSEAQRVDEMAKQEEAAYQAQRGDEGFDAARLGGNILNPANLAVGLRAANLVSKGRPLLQAAAGGVAGGLATPVLNTEEFGEEKIKQAFSGAVGGLAGKKLFDVSGRVLNPLVSKAEQTMRDLGVVMTPGQMMGKSPKALEEFAENIPLIGSYISNAKERQLFQFNKGVINKALSKVGAKLPDDVIGRDAVQFTDEVISKKYDDVLSKISIKYDQDLTSKFGDVVAKSTLPSAAQKQKVTDLINSTIYQKIPVNNKGTAVIDGQAIKNIESDLLKTVNTYRTSTSAEDRQIGDALSEVLKTLKNEISLQNPTQSSILRRIDSAYGDVSVMKTAAATSSADNGVFTPKQYKSAVRQRDITRNKRNFASGGARGQDVAESAVDVLSPEIASSVEGRLALGFGGAYGALSDPVTAMAIGVATPTMYSSRGLKMMEAMMRSRPDIARKVGELLKATSPKAGSITGAEIVEAYNKATETNDKPFKVEGTISQEELRQNALRRSGQ